MKNAFNILIIIAVLVVLFIYVPKKPKVDVHSLTFDRPDVNIIHVSFDNFMELNRALKKDSLRLQGRHRGKAVWYMTPEGEPIGDCTIYYVKGDLIHLEHEKRHCREGQFHEVRD